MRGAAVIVRRGMRGILLISAGAGQRRWKVTDCWRGRAEGSAVRRLKLIACGGRGGGSIGSQIW